MKWLFSVVFAAAFVFADVGSAEAQCFGRGGVSVNVGGFGSGVRVRSGLFGRTIIRNKLGRRFNNVNVQVFDQFPSGVTFFQQSLPVFPTSFVGLGGGYLSSYGASNYGYDDDRQLAERIRKEAGDISEIKGALEDLLNSMAQPVTSP